VLRFSDLERAIPNITQKMLGQQLRRMESDGIVVRKVYPQVPPKVEYSLTTWGQALCPALDAILKWADLRQQPSVEHIHPLTTNRGDSAVSEVIVADDLRASGTAKAGESVT